MMLEAVCTAHALPHTSAGLLCAGLTVATSLMVHPQEGDRAAVRAHDAGSGGHAPDQQGGAHWGAEWVSGGPGGRAGLTQVAQLWARVHTGECVCVCMCICMCMCMCSLEIC